MIKRETYLDLLRGYKNKPIIKVLTGLRRVGKSTLLKLFAEDLQKNGVASEHILSLNFELPENFDITNFRQLTDFVMNWSKNKTGPLYVFLDEIGRVSEWEKAVNGFHALNQFDLYITGSNADLLSSDLSTYLAGRFVEILVHPFSYKEFRQMNPQSTLNQYVTFGGMPNILPFNLEYEYAMNILRDSFRSAVLQDVMNRHNLRNGVVLEKLINYIFVNTGKTFSALSISNFLRHQKLTASVDTVLSYLNILQEAFLIYKVPRFDLIGKQVLKTEEKYYIADHGLREALVGSNGKVIELILENMVFIELKRRGNQVYIGKVGPYEIDFVAYKNNQISYYQVSYLMSLESTREREFSVFKNIRDNYPKYVISMDSVNFSQDGIIHLNMEDFLLEK